MCANHGLAGGARANSRRNAVSQFVEEEEEEEGNHGGMNWKENCRAEGEREEGRRFIARGKEIAIRYVFRFVLRGVKGIRSLSRRANSRLAELSGPASSQRDSRRRGERPRKFSTTFAK